MPKRLFKCLKLKEVAVEIREILSKNLELNDCLNKEEQLANEEVLGFCHSSTTANKK
jgi:hypothetical protein